MHQNHKLPRLPSLIPHQHARPQTILTQCNRVNESKVPVPGCLRLVGEVLWTKAEVQLDAIVNLSFTFRLGGGLSEEFPAGGASEAVDRKSVV